MKNLFNKILSPIGLEIHGKNYITKLKAESNSKNPFEVQREYFKQKSINVQTIFDLGANTGITIKKYLNYFPNAKIHAFEPTIEIEDELKNNFSNNKNIILNFKAVSDKNASVIFYKNKINDTNSIFPSVKIGASSDNACINEYSYHVETITLDEYCLNNNINEIDILKMDIQGAELLALKGAEKLLKNKKIKLIFTELYFKEQYKNQALFHDIYSFLITFGYKLQDFYNPYFVDNLIAWCDVIFTHDEK